MRTVTISVFLGALMISALAGAQDAEGGVTLSEEEGKPKTPPPVVQVKSTAAPPPAAATAPGQATAPSGVGGGSMGVSAAGYGNYGGPATSTDGDWGFRYNGYFRAPMNIGFGKRSIAATDQSTTTISNIQVPDREYYNWQHTPNAAGPWVELFFGYGNGVVESKIAIQAFTLTDPTFNDIDEQGGQVGISQAFVSISPDVSDIIENARFNVRVGAFWNRYGGAGKYDAGAYDAYTTGRTHILGGTWRGELDLDGSTLWVEHSVGTKQPSPSVSTNTKFTLLHHAHVGIDYDSTINLALHYMHSWTQEQDHQCVSNPDSGALLGACQYVGTERAPLDFGSPDGSLDVYGADVRFNMDAWGELFLGYALINAKDASTVDGAIEVAHAQGGGFFTSGVTGVYLNERGTNAGTLEGNGQVHVIQAQYDFSLSTIIGPDVFGTAAFNGSLFGMYNIVNSDDDPGADGVKKLKFGTDLLYSPLNWFGIGLRADHLRPNSKIEQQNFSIVSPRLVFRSDFATHEEISLIYSHYFYQQRECRTSQDLYCAQMSNGPTFPDGFGAFSGVTQPVTVRGGPIDPNAEGLYMPPQENKITLQATIWW
jgi:hypothetical protein